MNPGDRVELAEMAGRAGLLLRPASPDEAERAKAQWLKGVRPSKSESGPWGAMLRAPSPGHSIAPSLWRFAMETQIAETLAASTVLVADLAAVPGEPVGWVAIECGRVHWVHVIGPARRRGIGSVLLKAARAHGAEAVTYMTPEGHALMLSVSRQCEAPAPTTCSGSTDREDACPSIGGTSPAA